MVFRCSGAVSGGSHIASRTLSEITNKFGDKRVIHTPISENAITGAAIGAAMNGMRPILELMFIDFAMLAMDQICNNLGQWRYITGNQYQLPMTIRTATGGGMRMAYGQCLESQLIQPPGLILVEPSTPYDAKGILKSAIRGDDPVIFFEDKETIFKSVEKTNRLVIVEEGRIRGGLGAEIAALACSDD